MRGFQSSRPLLVVALSATWVACDSACVIPPCAPPNAMALTIQIADGHPVTNASVQFTGPEQGSQPCAGSCMINGSAGTYQLIVTAPGFQTVNRSVTVSGAAAKSCSCETVTTEHVTITVTPGT